MRDAGKNAENVNGFFERMIRFIGAALLLAAAPAVRSAPAEGGVQRVLARIGTEKGICAVLGLPPRGGAEALCRLAQESDLIIYFQSVDEGEVGRVREAAEAARILGSRIFADGGAWTSIHLADNLVDAVLVTPSAREGIPGPEVLRVVRPGGKAIFGRDEIIKVAPEGVDDWSHVYHGPDNNPQSEDRVARSPYLTQYIGEPTFCPMPEETVAANGRIFKAFGHIAHKANQNPMLNKLLGINAYNGTILWQRDLTGRFMIHRNTMIATADTLYMADDESCKLIDARTGEIRDRIAIPDGIGDGPVWKWMALESGVLYALVGGSEFEIATHPSNKPGMGHWPWGMWEGHDYSDPKKNFGFGRTFVAIDPGTKRILWTHGETEYVDARGVCMKGGRIYAYSPEKLLVCLDAKTGDPIWKTSAPDLMQAIGPNGRAQGYITGYSTTTYIKCDDERIYFAGPQRSRLVVASTKDGRLLWQKESGNFQLVLRTDGIYAVGPQKEDTGAKLAYETGDVLAKLPMRRACTRATGSADSVFYRTTGGTARIETATGAARHLAPMRPPCQDGVIIVGGVLHWGPWMCGCQLSLYGSIGLAPAGPFDFRPPLAPARLESGPGDIRSVAPFEVAAGDWPAYLGDASRRAATEIPIPPRVRRAWTFASPSAAMPTAPVIAGDTVFVADRAGVVRALDANGTIRWKAYTGGAVYFPPAVALSRVFVGSADGWVYAFEASSGRRLWRFRLAPAERRIPVFGTLISTWPVAGGIAVRDGIVYAVAGIAHYDGTYVAALDATTGDVKWYNDTSGILSEKAMSGISLQGELSIVGGELRFAGGNVYDVARYDLKTGACLNPPYDGINSRFQTAFYAHYPEYGQFLSLNHTYPDGTTASYFAGYEGTQHTNLALLAPPASDAPKKEASPLRLPGTNRRPTDRKVLWQVPGWRFNGSIAAPNAILAAAQTGAGADAAPLLAAIDRKDGSALWRVALPEAAVKGGVAIDREARIVVSLKDGQVLCFTASP
ncbi:MAG: PQQ-binding-like beta-propeller repeat protein [Planctomycetes bacterium]|nr:PQQ-binding-like beta-propeller repeat protein [Planctomycetota bacterium]